MQRTHCLGYVQNPFAELPASRARGRLLPSWEGSGGGSVHGECDSCSQNVIHRVILEELDVFPSPGDHFLDALLQADLRLPADILLDGAAVQPVLAVLAESVTG